MPSSILPATGQDLAEFWKMMDTMTISMATFETALGRCGVRWGDAGITGVLLPGSRSLVGPTREAGADVPAFVRRGIDGMTAVMAGGVEDLRDVPLDLSEIDELRRAVYAATREIPAGSTRTYGEIARAIDRLDREGARDVGSALAKNPFPIIVPCHRVVAANGALLGFSAPGGLETKRRMLELEGAPGYGQQVLFG
jgi:methylated-DNA-[protein]-cysteine S-methyltransferase